MLEKTAQARSLRARARCGRAPCVSARHVAEPRHLFERDGAPSGAGGREDDTDSDTFSNAVREQVMTMTEPVNKRGGAAAAAAAQAAQPITASASRP